MRKRSDTSNPIEKWAVNLQLCYLYTLTKQVEAYSSFLCTFIFIGQLVLLYVIRLHKFNWFLNLNLDMSSFLFFVFVFRFDVYEFLVIFHLQISLYRSWNIQNQWLSSSAMNSASDSISMACEVSIFEQSVALLSSDHFGNLRCDR